MSFDLVFFDPDAVPKSREAFHHWFDEVANDEGYSSIDHEVCSEKLKGFFRQLAETFPPMNGPLAAEDVGEDEDSNITDYSFGKHIIYACFAWSVAESAYFSAKDLAAENSVGFYNISDSSAELVIPGVEPSEKPWWKFW